MLILHRSAASLAAAAVLLTACAAQPGSSTVSPATATTPAPTASATPSDQALFIEAERVFRAYYSEALKYYASGGADRLPPVFEKWVVGEFRNDTLELLEVIKRTGDRFLGPDPTIKVRPAAGVVYEDSQVAIQACVNSTKSRFRNGKGKEYAGHITLHTSFLKRVDGNLKIFSNRTERVDSCDQ